jgi:methylglutaconyl-CoA hydratase
VPLPEIDDAIDRFVREFLTAGPEAIAAAKTLIADVTSRPLSDAQQLTARAIASRRVSPEGQEGLRAFLEKRAPRWKA